MSTFHIWLLVPGRASFPESSQEVAQKMFAVNVSVNGVEEMLGRRSIISSTFSHRLWYIEQRIQLPN